MNKHGIALPAAAAGAPTLPSTVLITSMHAHGSMESPVSRVHACFPEKPESPDTAACEAAVTTGGARTSPTPPLLRGHYRCLQSHTSLTGWEPSDVPALWRRL